MTKVQQRALESLQSSLLCLKNRLVFLSSTDKDVSSLSYLLCRCPPRQLGTGRKAEQMLVGNRLCMFLISSLHCARLAWNVDVTVFLSCNQVTALSQRQSQQKNRHYEWSNSDAPHWRADADEAGQVCVNLHMKEARPVSVHVHPC